MHKELFKPESEVVKTGLFLMFNEADVCKLNANCVPHSNPFVTQSQSQASVETFLYLDTVGHNLKVKCQTETGSLLRKYAFHIAV